MGFLNTPRADQLIAESMGLTEGRNVVSELRGWGYQPSTSDMSGRTYRHPSGHEVRVSYGKWTAKGKSGAEHSSKDVQSLRSLLTGLHQSSFKESLDEGSDDGQERIQAAVITHRGETHTGRCHDEAYAKAEKKHGIPRIKSAPEGFATTRGRQVSRAEAFKIARAAGQLSPKFNELQDGPLESHMIHPGDPHFNGERPSLWDIPVARGIRNWPRATGKRPPF